MTQIDTILFDMDGVACDWQLRMARHMTHYHGINVIEEDERGTFDWFNKHPKSNEWVTEMYTMDQLVFSQLPKIPQFDDLFSTVISVGRVYGVKHFGWLSAIDMRHPSPRTVIHSKMDWIERNIEPIVSTIHHTRFAFGSADKVTYARPNVLLIDDFKRNTDAFTKAGGHAVLLDDECAKYNVSIAIRDLTNALNVAKYGVLPAS